MRVENDEDIGYCPLGDQALMTSYIEAIENIWYQDNCHTLDRENLAAQLECGVGNFDTSMEEAVDLRFQVYFYPWVQELD